MIRRKLEEFLNKLAKGRKLKNKILLSSFCILILSGCTAKANSTFMEQQVMDANNYSQKNQDDIDSYVKAKQVLKRQAGKIESYKTEYSYGDYTIDDPYVVVDPYGTNNLTAFVAFESSQAIKYKYTVAADYDYPFAYSNDDFQKGTVIIPIAGLLSDRTNNVEIETENKKGIVTTSFLRIDTDESSVNAVENSKNIEQMTEDAGVELTNEQVTILHDALTGEDEPVITTKINEEDAKNDYDGFILTADYDIYDLAGNIRFSFNIGMGNNPLKLNEGRYLTMDNQGLMYEMDYFGKIYQIYVPPASQVSGEHISFHHDATFSSDGQYIYALAGFTDEEELLGSEDAKKYLRETLILKYDRETGECVDVYDYSDEFAESPQSNAHGADKTDPLHMNSIEYVDSVDQLIVSAQNQSMIMGIDSTSGSVEWIIKDPSAVIGENRHLLLAAKNEMTYTSGNYTAFPIYTDKYMTTGDDLYISVFNNRNCLDENNEVQWTKTEKEIKSCVKPEYSSVLIYHINLENRTVETVKEIIPDEEKSSAINPSVYTNSNGDYQVQYANINLSDDEVKMHSDLYITDEKGNVKIEVALDGLKNVYRSRLINLDEITESLNETIDTLEDSE